MKKITRSYIQGGSKWIILVILFMVAGVSRPRLINAIYPDNEEVLDAQIDEIENLLYLAAPTGEVVYARQKIQEAHRALLMSERLEYNRGVIKSHYIIALSYFFTGDFQRSMDYVSLIEKLKEVDQHVQYLAQMHYLKGRIYLMTGLPEWAEEELIKALDVSPKISSPNSRELILANTHAALSYLYSLGDNAESAGKERYHLMQSGLSHDRVDPSYKASPLPEYFVIKVNNMIDRQELDSAAYFVQRLKAFSLETQHIGFPAIYNALGRYYMVNNQLDSAYHYLQEGVSATHRTSINSAEPQLYLHLSQYFKLIGNADSSNIYYTKHLTVENQEIERRIEAGEDVLRRVMKRSEVAPDNSRMRIILVALLSATIGLAVLLHYYSRKHKRTQEKRLKVHATKLEATSNLSFDELIRLAKQNDPAFMGTFQQVYSEFWTKLFKQHPDLTQAEQELCAYTYLNFTTKQIADITNIQVGSVQTRRSRLRRKIKLERDVDLYDYLIKL